MKKLLFPFVFFLLFTTSRSQTLIVFKTFDDFLNNKGEKHEGLTYSGANTGPAFMVLVFNSLFGKFRLSQKGHWGFIYKGQLYKFDNRRDPVWVGIVGKNIVYYENGYAHLNEKGYCPAGWFYYLSADLNSDPFVIPTRRHVYKRIMEANPECKPLFECIDQKNANYKKCVEKFEKIKCGTQFPMKTN